MNLSGEIVNTPALESSILAGQKKKNKGQLISLGLGEPEYATPPQIIEATHRAMVQGFTRYSNPFGLEELRQSICAKLSKDNSIEADIDNVIVTPGNKNGLFLALAALIQPEDEVINLTPNYVSYIPEIKLAEPRAQVHNIDLRKADFKVDWELLAKVVNTRTRAIILNSPQNPTGSMLDREDFEILAKIISRYQCYVISDEIYEKLNHSGLPHLSPASMPGLKAKVITINGFSKAYSMTGWRIGYVVAEKAIVRTMSRIQAHINTNTCTFVQKGAIAALDMDGSHIEDYNHKLAERADYMTKSFAKIGQFKLVEPKGGLFGFLGIGPTNLHSDTFATRLLESKNVVVNPGIVFGKNWDDYIRISMATSTSKFKEGIDLIIRFAADLGIQ